ncbi:MAG TPA: type IV toxin-antitoxin system AbiEi family antitoxin domain-containing protein [Planctomycetota bacterium]|nr:type IV toxin-antitoxin system AbiEi family antitoxin domain-containing protein [Planctomycetota bacterium]
MPARDTGSTTHPLRRLRTLKGAFRTSQARTLGIDSRTLRQLRDNGHVEQLARGVYRVADLPPPANPDLLIVAARLPQAVLCLISALAFHDLTEEVPHEVHIALPRGAEQPRFDHPPLRVVRLKPASIEAGVQVHRVDGLDLRVFSPAKTVADCFQFRAQVGLDTALSALKALRRRRGFDPEELLRFARICRVERLVSRYLEAIL